MPINQLHRCPYCAEDVPADAVRCRWCRGRVAAFDRSRWHRGHAERRLAGVAAALAHSLALPLAAVRVAFVALAFVHLLGPILYGALWLTIPADDRGRAPLERGFDRLCLWLGHRFPSPPAAGGWDARHARPNGDASSAIVSGGPQP